MLQHFNFAQIMGNNICVIFIELCMKLDPLSLKGKELLSKHVKMYNYRIKLEMYKWSINSQILSTHLYTCILAFSVAAAKDREFSQKIKLFILPSKIITRVLLFSKKFE